MIISQNKPTIAVDVWSNGRCSAKVENAMGGAKIRKRAKLYARKVFFIEMDVMAAQGIVSHNNRSRLEYNVHLTPCGLES